jgi:hypothetical protein
MKRHLRPKRQLGKASERLRWLGLTLLLTLGLLVACTPKTETVTVEVTRVVTETVVEEGEMVEVTRVVTETVVETVEIAPEEEAAEEPPSATGSEGDAGPLPPPPDDGPKVAESRGPTLAVDLALGTAVTLRGSQTNNNATSQEVLITTFTALNPIELQKWCNLAAKLTKKRCE